MNTTFDYIIVGAGSSGAALANRLSENPENQVLLLEAGPKDRHPAIHIPLGFAALMKDKNNNWCYETEPEPEMNNRQMAFPKGKVMGGSSSINGMVYIRGQHVDYDLWEQQGAKGWSFNDVLPYFIKSEKNVRGASKYHGANGYLWVDEPINKFPLAEKFRKAGIETGLEDNNDFNGESQAGIGYYQVNIKNGKRQSVSKCYLEPVKERSNLHIVCKAQCEKVLIDNEKQATGIIANIKGKSVTLNAKKEVILSGGSIASPQILELSGIGQKEVLEKAGIEVKHELPGVGENLQDHLTINVLYLLKGINTFYEEIRPLAMLKNLYLYYAKGRGLLAHPAAEIGAFFKTSDDVERPNAQIHFAPAAGEYTDKGTMKTVPGTTATVCNLMPKSRGSVHVKTNNFKDLPAIKANFLTAEEDKKVMIDAVKKVREIFNAPILAEHRVKELYPGEIAQSDEAILDYVRDQAESVYHPVGTCKMGEDDMAVVDSRLKVHGIKGLRVVDGAIMPIIPAGNTNAPCVMIAEKAADMILQDNA